MNENLPSSLARELGSSGARVAHVADLGLAGRPDPDVWDLAMREDLIILTKDADYLDLAVAKGGARVIHLAVGNMRTIDLLSFVAGQMKRIVEFSEGNEPLLVLRPPS